MFRIGISLMAHSMSGLEALDERRRLKLEDSSHLIFYPHQDVKCDVSEGFARANFGRTQTMVSRSVSREFLVPGDLQVYSGYSVVFRSDLPAQRIMELWLAASK